MPARRTIPQAPGISRAAPILLASLLAAFPLVGAGAADFDLEVDEDRVTLNSNGADVAEVLRSLSEQAGFRLVLPARMSKQPLRLRMQDAPLRRVLDRLLRAGSFVVITGDDDRVVAIHVLPRGNEQTVFLDVVEGSGSQEEPREIPPDIPATNTDLEIDLSDDPPAARPE